MTAPQPGGPEPAAGPGDVEKAYNVAQSELFQLAAYGHHRYHPSGEALTDEGKRQLADYNARIRAAQEAFEAAVLAKAAVKLRAAISDLHRDDYWAVYYRIADVEELPDLLLPSAPSAPAAP